MIRQDVKNAIASSLQGVEGIRAIFTARQKITQNQQTPVITIYLPDVKESALTGLPAGKRRIEMTALLEIIMIDTNPKPEDGEAEFDAILDTIDIHLRQHFTLDGVVNGSAIKNLQTHVAAPQLMDGQNIFRACIKKFDVSLTIAGVDNAGNATYSGS